MTIEPARDVRRGTVGETAWFVAAGLLIVAGLITAVAVMRQWSPCGASPASQTCVTLKQTMNLLPIQADMALRVSWAAPLAALALTLATSAWIAFLLLHPLARGIKIFQAGLAVTLVMMSIGGWLGVLSVDSWVAHGGAWITVGRSQNSWPLASSSTPP